MHKNAIFGDLSYGYPMGMVWVSYGAHSHFFLIWLIFDNAWSQKIRGAVGVSDGRAGNSIALKWTNVFDPHKIAGKERRWDVAGSPE